MYALSSVPTYVLYSPAPDKCNTTKRNVLKESIVRCELSKYPVTVVFERKRISYCRSFDSISQPALFTRADTFRELTYEYFFKSALQVVFNVENWCKVPGLVNGPDAAIWLRQRIFLLENLGQYKQATCTKISVKMVCI